MSLAAMSCPALRTLRFASPLRRTAQLQSPLASSRSILLPLTPSPSKSSTHLLHKQPYRQLQSSSKDGGNGGKPEGTPNVEEYPAFSLESLGLSKNMKTAVITLICIFGTIETWFWCKAAWRWWKNRTGTEDDGPEAAK